MQRSDLQFNFAKFGLALHQLFEPGKAVGDTKRIDGGSGAEHQRVDEFAVAVFLKVPRLADAVARRETLSDAGEMPLMINDCILSLLIVFLANSIARAAGDHIDTAI